MLRGRVVIQVPGKGVRQLAAGIGHRIPVIPENKDYVWADEVLMPQRAQRIFPKGDYYLTDAESFPARSPMLVTWVRI